MNLAMIVGKNVYYLEKKFFFFVWILSVSGYKNCHGKVVWNVEMGMDLHFSSLVQIEPFCSFIYSIWPFSTKWVFIPNDLINFDILPDYSKQIASM